MAGRGRERLRARVELKGTAYEIFIGMLSVLSIANLVLYVVFSADADLQTVLSIMDSLLSVIFLADFLYRFFTTPSKPGYFFRGFGWADLLASLPFPQAKLLRLFQVIRVVQLMVTVGPRTLWGNLIHHRANSALMTLLLLGVLVLEFGSLGVLGAENHADGANITTAADALWYTVVTISTVGYGDQYPVSLAGRLIGVLIIVIGVGIFGTFTGYLANVFLGPDRGAGSQRQADANDASTGIAAGAASGAVTSGWESSSARAGGADPHAADDRTARIEALLAQSEQALAEVRALLAQRDGPAD